MRLRQAKKINKLAESGLIPRHDRWWRAAQRCMKDQRKHCGRQPKTCDLFIGDQFIGKCSSPTVQITESLRKRLIESMNIPPAFFQAECYFNPADIQFNTLKSILNLP